MTICNRQLVFGLLRKLDRLADLWVKGVDFDWQRLYDGKKPKRLSLPTYPFMRERYWVTPSQSTGHVQEERLHPLIHRNTSDFAGQRYSTHLKGNEWFLRDHIVQSRAIVPGVIQLEWARAAVAQTFNQNALSGGVILENVAWIQPLVVEHGLDVYIDLDLIYDDRIRYQIYSDDGEERVYSQGEAFIDTAADAPSVDLAMLRSQCQRLPEKEEIYPTFERLGVSYGPSFKVLQEVYLAPSLAIGELQLPQNTEQEAYLWIGGLLDGAFQTTGALAEAETL